MTEDAGRPEALDQALERLRLQGAIFMRAEYSETIGAAWTTALLEVSGLSSGERVLDVACGTGIVTRRASELVGREGFVAGSQREDAPAPRIGGQ